MNKRIAIAFAVFLLAGCGGGGSSNSVPAAAPAKAQTAATGSVIISIPVASATSQALARTSARYPQFVSPNANSVALSINGGADAFFDVSATSSLCTTVAGTRNCTLSFGAPVGSDTFAFLVFAGANGTGAQLAAATATQTIAAATAFNFTVALNAVLGTVVANVVQTSGGGGCPNSTSGFNGIWEGCSGSAPVSYTVFDPSGAQVTGTTPYATPITIAASDPSVTANPSTITAPAQSLTLTYSGAALAPTVTTSIVVNLTVGTAVIPLSVPVKRQYLYIANSNAPYGSPPAGGGNVVVYAFGASGASPPARVLTGALTGFLTPTIPLVDSAGNLYVLDNGIPVSTTFNPTIKVFAPGANGNVAPTRQITNLGTATASNAACPGMTFDPTGAYLFISCGSDFFVISAATSGTPTVVASFENECGTGPGGLAFDNLGNLYLANGQSPNNEIDIYTGPIPTSGGFHLVCPNGSMDGTGGSAVWPSTIVPLQIAIDNSQTIYAPLSYQNATGGAPDMVAELGIWKSSSVCNNCAASATLTGAPFTTHAVVGVAFDAAGNVYVGNPFNNLITEFGRATINAAIVGTNNAPVLRTISDTTTASTTALGLAVGP